MSDVTRDYMSYSEGAGSVKISEEVIASISAIAAGEVKGVSGLSGGMAGDIAAGLLGKKSISRGVKVVISAESVSLDIFILVRYGHVIPEVAKKVQEVTALSVESMTGLKVSAVNVNVSGVSFDKGDKEPKKQKQQAENK